MESHESHFNDRFFDVYQNSGVETLVSWHKPVHRHEAWGLNRFNLPETERISNEVLSLSMYRRLKEYLLGTRVREKEGATKHICGGVDWGESSRDDWVRSYWDSQDHPHRTFLMERISKFSPNSILEIGCNCGLNLRLLAKKFPDAEIRRGIDINPAAVQRGNEWLMQEGISNVKLLEGKADELERFQDRSFDVVYSDAVLMYIGPDKIKEVMGSMIRIARHALILVERHSEDEKKDPYGLGIYHGCWKRDYVALLKQYIQEEQIHVIKITEDIWPEENWKKMGAVVEVVIG